ncbi:hypothetical protein [Paucihalobacter ruber]|uniref:hypothetical protein n=1 Tax=Paucihalobacter ruber TaxID=2567861 RepID=UPI001C1EBB75|nr:hypothetical protein [Paucihalobacter ruber]
MGALVGKVQNWEWALVANACAPLAGAPELVALVAKNGVPAAGTSELGWGVKPFQGFKP